MHNLCINHKILLFFYQIIPEGKYICISDMAYIRSDSSFKPDFMKGVGRTGRRPGLSREKIWSFNFYIWIYNSMSTMKV